MKIAIIDDDEQQLDITRRQFQRSGWEVLTINYQIGATNAVRAFAPHAVILDLEMPIRGVDLIKTMRREVPSALYVLRSSVDEAKLRRAVAETGAHLGFSKSKALVEIIDAVTKMVAK
jgi:two-component system, OmpR family, response regulator